LDKVLKKRGKSHFLQAEPSQKKEKDEGTIYILVEGERGLPETRSGGGKGKTLHAPRGNPF